jgi:SAM-dependent MidA family methyltransferase
MQMKMLVELIQREIIESGGVLPFVRFMELALYCPKLGYYETNKDSVGRSGDFYTSVSVGNLFGELLAFQFAEWLTELKITEKLKIVEAGSHNGQLAKDILSWLKSNRPELFGQIDYCIIEPSESRRQWQRGTLKDFAGKVHWFSSFEDSKLQGINGIVFSNELLDAFPVHRLGWDAKNRRWFEWGVKVEGEKFAWAKMEGSFPIVPELPSTLLEILPDNFTIETNPAAETWWRLAGKSLHRGKLMTADYGLAEEEFFLPSRKNGTLRAYTGHRFADDILANPGEQDLTSHVNFSAIQRAGEEAGLKTDYFSAQARFLAQILQKTMKDGNFGEWTSARGRQFQTLTHPEHLGRAFNVLVQSR